MPEQNKSEPFRVAISVTGFRFRVSALVLGAHQTEDTMFDVRSIMLALSLASNLRSMTAVMVHPQRVKMKENTELRRHTR